MLRNSARDFLKTECPKRVVREIEESESGYSPELWEKMADLGWMGIIIPEEYGGVGMGLLELAVLFEEFGRAALPGPMFATAMGTLALLEAGTPDQKKRFLPEVTSGKLILTLAVDEPDALYDPRFVGLRAVRHQGDGYAVTGTKLMVPYPHVAGYLIVVARTSGEAGNENGLTLFMAAGNAPGIGLIAAKTISSDRQYQVEFSGVPVPAGDLLGKADQAWAAVRSVLEKALALQCAEAVGGAQHELEVTAEYTKNRVQFGRPIGTFQAVQHRLADMFIDVQAARWTTYQAVWRLSEGLPASREVSIAKGITGRAVQRVAFSAQQLHGGIGVDLDYDLHFYYRRAKAFELKLGTPAFHFNALGAQL